MQYFYMQLLSPLSILSSAQYKKPEPGTSLVCQCLLSIQSISIDRPVYYPLGNRIGLHSRIASWYNRLLHCNLGVRDQDNILEMKFGVWPPCKCHRRISF